MYKDRFLLPGLILILAITAAIPGCAESRSQEKATVSSSYQTQTDKIFDRVIDDLLTLIMLAESYAKKPDENIIREIEESKITVKKEYLKITELKVPTENEQDHKQTIKNFKFIMEGIDLLAIGLQKDNKSLISRGNLLIQNNIDDLYKYQRTLSQSPE